jgi:hypothetical protein
VLPPRTRNTRGNEGTITDISGKLVNNGIIIVSFNSALSKTIIQNVLVNLLL